MSIYICRVENGRKKAKFHLATEEWALPALFRVFEDWLENESDSLDDENRVVEWIVDIGFVARENVCGNGPTISPRLMQTCVNHNISIHLAEYGD
ncbi:hypothetical protein [Teredinibacter sp. KSP-S5-2]|uniref:hypothetical protein n=1 Tax=Teredinibacter sp. KSP-S5-2 TaxID=3034506 RepID=UPI002934ED2D|nr:hypothetical protein [Teredinibacter sp. KSP-S5-2]WNO10630.1 hypothetical protein P5V12_05525 [Teredinibacter sp. KSP-S5-2]